MAPKQEDEEKRDRGFNLRAGAFLFVTAGIGALVGFGGALANVKKAGE